MKFNVVPASFRLAGNPPELLFVFDPGNDTGYAVFQRGWLIAAGLIDWNSKNPREFPHAKSMGWGCTHLAVEVPQIYRATKTKAKPESLIKEAILVGRIVDRYHTSPQYGDAEIAYLTPREWKGQTSKPISHSRVFKRLQPQEENAIPGDLAILKQRALEATRGAPYSAKIHNVLDAIGIGFWILGR